MGIESVDRGKPTPGPLPPLYQMPSLQPLACAAISCAVTESYSSRREKTKKNSSLVTANRRREEALGSPNSERISLYQVLGIDSTSSSSLVDVKAAVRAWLDMDDKSNKIFLSELSESICGFFRRCLFRMLTFGPIPEHIAFIMDGNRRFSQSRNLKPGTGHRVGFLALMSILRHCYDLGVKYVTIYAFSIDNFKRRPEEVQYIMDLMMEKIKELLKEESIVNKYGIKVNFFGNLNMLDEPVRRMAERAMVATTHNNRAVLSVCVAYTCTDEIIHAAQESCRERWAVIREGKLDGTDKEDGVTECFGGNDLEESAITLVDLDRNMYTAGCPDPDILIRTSGETRLSNFLLWQTTFCLLLAPDALWPEISLRHLVWAILEYQRMQPYLEKKKKQL